MYTNSWMVRVGAKITTVSRPGTTSSSTTRVIAPSRLQPSTIADSSTPLGSVWRNPIRSQVQNGTVNVG